MTRRSTVASLLVVTLAALACPASDLSAQTLGIALDAPTIPFSTTTYNGATEQADPSIEWFYQTAVSQTGGDAAEASALPANSFTRIDAVVDGPATIRFKWRKDAPNSGDNAINRLGFFSTDFSFPVYHGQNGEWEERTIEIGCGEQTISWFYENNHPRDDADPANRAWLDEVVVTQLPPSPEIQAGLDNTTTNFYSDDWIDTGNPNAPGARNGTVAQSGPVANDNETSAVTFDADGPFEISFDWGMESNPDYGSTLTFSVNGRVESELNGSTQLTSAGTLRFGPGEHCMAFTYDKGEPFFFDPENPPDPWTGGDEGFVDNLVVTRIPASASLADAVDRTGDVYGKLWNRQTQVTRDGIDAAWVTGIDRGEFEVMYVELPDEPGLLSFWYKMSTEQGGGFMDAQVDGEFIAGATGEKGWTRVEANLGQGQNRELRLYYSRTQSGGDGNLGDNALYIDEIKLEPGVTNYRPDLSVKAPRTKRYKGNNRYNRSGAGQLAKYIPRLRRPTGKFRLRVQNDCRTDPDEMTLVGTRANRQYEILYVVRVDGQLLNISAEFQTGRFSSGTLETLQSEPYQIWVFPKEGYRRRVQTVRVRAFSGADRSKFDTAKVRLKLRRRRR